MANLDITFRSQSLTRPTTFHLIWPNDVPPDMKAQNPHYGRPCKTLFLLHGYTAGYKEWPSCSPIWELAMKYNLAVVCPDGGISFYLDGKGAGTAWCRYVSEELPTYLQQNFGLADGPENTFVGGESMGGFGALHTALSRPETFGCAIALSSALIIHQVASMRRSSGPVPAMADYDYYTSTFGDPAGVEDSANNPETLVKRLLAAGKAVPRLFMACGTEDFLIENNRAFHDFLMETSVPVSYHEAPGVHNFEFWNQWIEPGIRWALEL